MYTIRPTSGFEKDIKRIFRRGYDLSHLSEIVKILSSGEPLPQQYRDHPLVDNYTGCRECRITPAWRLIYEIAQNLTNIFKYHISIPELVAIQYNRT